MTTEITYRPGTEGLMAALSVAEQLTAASPVVPSSLQLNDCQFDYAPGTNFQRPMGVLVHFHRNVEDVRKFAEAFSLTVAERPNGDEDVYTYADGVLDGVPFRAWTLVDAKAAAVAA